MTFGSWGERTAEAYLKKQGYELLERNYRCRIGELDLVMKEGDTIVFVEVKTRMSLAYGLPSESITKTKQQHIRRTAQQYVSSQRLEGWDLRLDVVEILRTEGKTYIHHITDAF